MSSKGGGYNRNLMVRLDNNPKINGLAELTKRLEKSFFADVQVRNCATNSENVSLIIELTCNFKLKEIVFFLKNNQWGATQTDCCGVDPSNLSRAIKDLRRQNSMDIDIEEFSIFLNNTSIIIKKIYQESIQHQLPELFKCIVEHYKHITKNCRETPYEMYIPVFEEDLQENDSKIARIEQHHNERQDYVGYWGLYFDSEDDAVIYDLPRKRIITGDLFMLNH